VISERDPGSQIHDVLLDIFTRHDLGALQPAQQKFGNVPIPLKWSTGKTIQFTAPGRDRYLGA
jgi:hypothetical protein